jgi:hypothetical protein
MHLNDGRVASKFIVQALLGRAMAMPLVTAAANALILLR